eukprot:2004240-Pyramimonas_sp.AAC.1
MVRCGGIPAGRVRGHACDTLHRCVVYCVGCTGAKQSGHGCVHLRPSRRRSTCMMHGKQNTCPHSVICGHSADGQRGKRI